MAIKGQISLFAGSFAPTGWAYCDGKNGNPSIPNIVDSSNNNINYIICTQDSNYPLVGEIRTFGGNYAPFGWLLCEGQVLNVNGNNALFFAIGANYGGNGRETFGIPKMANLKSLVGTGESRYIICVNGDFPNRP